MCNTPTNSQENIDKIANTFSEILICASEKSLTRKKEKSNNKPRNKKWFNKDLRSMRYNLINYGKVYSSYPNDPNVKNHYYKMYRIYTKTLKKTRKTYKQSILNQIENLHNNDPKQYWKLINDLYGKENEVISNSEINPSTWYSHFESLNSIKDEFKNKLQELDIKLSRIEKENICFNELDYMITEAEISSALSKLKCNKSPGLDNISNHMLKTGHHLLLPTLKKIFNFCFSHSIYPSVWASGYITPIHKSGIRSDPNNYRGITVTSAVGKLFNSILNNRLEQFLTKNKVIDSCQLGFTKHARSSDHMFILKTIIDKYCNSKDGRVYSCFVDFQKAFDTVIHTGVKLKLLELGIGNRFYNIIKKMYEVSTSSVKCNNLITDAMPVTLGVKQGDNLSPNLFKIFINDLPKYLQDCIDCVSLNDQPINCLLYADDLVLLSSSLNGLQERLDNLNRFCNDWCLSINPMKTKVLIFNKAGRLIQEKILFNNIAIECVQNYKYLGIHFTASGSFATAQAELYKKAMKAYFKLNKNFLSYKPGPDVAIHIFDHTVTPILLYGSEIWGVFNPLSSKFKKDKNIISALKDLKCEKLHTKFCRQILGVHKKASTFGVLSELGRFSLSYNLLNNILNYWHRLENIGTFNNLISNAYETSKELHFKNIPSWYSTLNAILANIPDISSAKVTSLSFTTFKKQLKTALRVLYLNHWNDTRQENLDSKLRTYTKFKCNFQREKYLTIIKNYDYRRSFSRFRISCHKLIIETGRYKNIPAHLRICPHCTSASVGDEIHFLLTCEKFNVARLEMLKAVSKECSNFNCLHDWDKFLWLMNNENPGILKSVCNFINLYCD